jgi:hypothetical protein
MNREVHVRFWERLGVKVPWATRRSAASVCETNDGTEDKEITIKFTSGERAERA